MPQKIIFLDIDGPMIPNTSFLFDVDASFCQVLDERCCAVLRKIIDASGAKIVFNTTHNILLYEKGSPGDRLYTPGLLQRFKDAGFEDDIHESCHTTYPDTDRWTAIQKWLADNDLTEPNVVLWVAFDDVPIAHKRAYLTNPDLGIGIGEFNHAAKYLMFRGMGYL